MVWDLQVACSFPNNHGIFSFPAERPRRDNLSVVIVFSPIIMYPHQNVTSMEGLPWLW